MKHKLEGMPDESWTSEQLWHGICSWTNTVVFTSYEQQIEGRGYPNPNDAFKFLEGAGRRMEKALDILRTRIK